LVLVTMLVSQSVPAQSVRIMSVGDSDVSGYAGYASYRYDLWFMLNDAGYDARP
jgi:hypothetical protein